MTARTNTAGRWDPKAWPTYFIASDAGSLDCAYRVHDHLLIAVNELSSDDDLELVRKFIRCGCRVLIDSGIFWLSTQHARAHDISMDEALTLAPDQIDGFAGLKERYLRLIGELGSQAWGYIEIDQGGRENKLKTRASLEALGLRPIPVYHPFNDGWDYFDFLAERYDRICFGNIVQADGETRKRLIATAWERRRKYPNLWIHALGLRASELLAAWPINSCDASTWLSSVRWGVHHANVANKTCWPLGAGFNYEIGAEEGGRPVHIKAREFCGYDAGFMARQMRVMSEEARTALGCDVGAIVQ